jgi:hypothetical protein
MPNAETRQLLGWEPVHPDLIADLEQGRYFTTPPRATVLFAQAELNEAMELLARRPARGSGHPHSRTPGNARSCISSTVPVHVSASSSPPPDWFVHLRLAYKAAPHDVNGHHG